ncbi:unnamed protein product [Caenorhabditis bovis]|uniref:C-type lectin domain-containing protein n=1 Tax=Caenorhabditis bovis TaxID=2654633 RepID=A0A8S1EZH9_9PELO|nr:unnamed protein product [Caenorhabditis bovis]
MRKLLLIFILVVGVARGDDECAEDEVAVPGEEPTNVERKMPVKAGSGTCKDGWTRFERKNGVVVCLKAIRAQVTYNEAVNLCKNHQSQLFGIDSADELNYLKDNLGSIYVFIGAYRKKDCQFEASVLTTMPKCSSDKMFEFTDGVTKSNFLWFGKWSGGVPNSLFVDNEYESAIVSIAGQILDVSSKSKLNGALCGTVA